jgi:hypothetical protein
MREKAAAIYFGREFTYHVRASECAPGRVCISLRLDTQNLTDATRS